MKQMPRIEKFMTAMPHSIGADIGLPTAQEMMREHRIRHLPVRKGGRLVGILSDRDIKLALSLTSAEKLAVEEVMTPDPYTVAPDAPIDEVVLHMAEKKYGCAVVEQQNGKLVGIFTTTDGMRVLGELLSEHYRRDAR
jgi:acetoin utilization protein AcuB